MEDNQRQQPVASVGEAGRSAVISDERGSFTLVLLYAATLFLSAGLLFSVQPMIGKMILPVLGGTPAVWNTCMVFFQALLLLGYLYAHLSTRWLSARHQAVAHLVLMLLPLLVLPIVLRGDLDTLPTGQPVYWLFGVLFMTAGLPFLVVATSAPLLQKWFARTGHPSSHDPYFLYAASNAGSLIALLCYPFLIEPMLTLAAQSRLWRDGYMVLVGLTVLCALMLWRFRPQRAGSAAAIIITRRETGPRAEAVTSRRRLLWVLYTFIPSSLMLGVTTYITNDIAAFPLMWVIPLTLYLLTFVLVFAKRQLLPRVWMGRVLAVLAAPAMVALIVEASYPHFVLIPEHLVLFFAAAMVCHGALAEDRPSTSHLTEYYLWMSIGGLLGGVFNTLVAPVLFSSIIEYPLMIILACLFRPPIGKQSAAPVQRRLDLALPAGIALLTAGLALVIRWWGLDFSRFGVLLTFALPALLVLSFADRPQRYALGLAAMLLGSACYIGVYGQKVDVERNFFGVVRVTDDPGGTNRLMVHGNTIHGSESLDPARRGVPRTYYHRDGPAGDIFAAFTRGGARRSVAAVGLGAGSLASYAGPDQAWTFYEINPAVERFARTPQYFTFLSVAEAGRLEVVLGDARLRLADAGDSAYGLIVLDAFSSDAIPVHLVTREALELYFEKLAPGGMIALHISNRYLDVEPVLGRIAAALGVVARTRIDLDVPVNIRTTTGREPSQWLVMVRSEEDLGPIRTDPAWRATVSDQGMPVWTDDYSNILHMLRW